MKGPWEHLRSITPAGCSHAGPSVWPALRLAGWDSLVCDGSPWVAPAESSQPHLHPAPNPSGSPWPGEPAPCTRPTTSAPESSPLSRGSRPPSARQLPGGQGSSQENSDELTPANNPKHFPLCVEETQQKHSRPLASLACPQSQLQEGWSRSSRACQELLQLLLAYLPCRGAHHLPLGFARASTLQCGKGGSMTWG